MSKDRHSIASEAELVTNPEEKAHREVRNGLLQFDLVEKLIDEGLDPERQFRLRVSTILNLQRQALDGLSKYAGGFRPAHIAIGKSKHEPPGAHQVPDLVEEMCDYVNEKWNEATPMHLAAYVMWRLNWIHPFTDGNGRTSRALSYLILCLKLKTGLPGEPTIPEQVTSEKMPYYKALEDADMHWRDGKIDLSNLEGMLAKLLANQLLSVHHAALGKST